MSLQVWLPLNGNTNNQGISNETNATRNTGTYSDGKIGKSLHLANTANILNATFPGIIDKTIWSVATWLKISSSEGTPSYQHFFNLGINNDGANNYFRFEHTNTAGYTQFITPKRTDYGSNTNGYWGFISGCNKAKDIWVHVAVTNDGTNYRTYFDGVLNTTTAINLFTPSTSKLTGTLQIGTSGAYCFLNDFRIYDHCLSPKEVKEISKALVCHYPLDNNGSGMLNYFVNSNFATGATTNWYGVNGSSIRVEIKDGRKCITGTKGTSSNITGQTIDSYNYVANSEITFTISADVYVEETGTFGVGNWISTTEASGWQGMSGSQTWHTSSTLKVGWNHISVTRIKGKNQYNGKIVTAFSYTGTTYWMTNVKFEFGDVETPWIPNSTDASYSIFNINGTTEFDTSGYKNNGTRSGSLSTSSDSPRYSACTVIPNQSYIKYRGPENMYYATYSFWVKFNSFTTYGAIHIPYTSPSGGGSPWFSANTESSSLWCYFGGNSPNYTKAGTGNLVTNTWYHFVYVWNNGVAQWYLNGEKIGNSVTYTTRTYIQNNADSTIGNSYTGSSWNGTPFNGCISDFRLYATALSDADILELYNTGASIDNGGNILTYDIQEK